MVLGIQIRVHPRVIRRTESVSWFVLRGYSVETSVAWASKGAVVRRSSCVQLLIRVRVKA